MKLWELVKKEEIHQEMAIIFTVTLFIVIGGILVAQHDWSVNDHEMYYAHSGALYDFLCIVLVPAFFAFVWGAIALALVVSSPSGSTEN